MAKEKEINLEPIESKVLPENDIEVKETPSTKMNKKNKPQVGNPENTITIGGTMVEIKPTKLLYHRNNVANFYKVVDLVPLPELVTLQAGSFGDDRDGDKALMDWLICVVDNPDLIRENYDQIDTETVEKMLSIFKRVNHISEKEEKQKNVQSRGKTE